MTNLKIFFGVSKISLRGIDLLFYKHYGRYSSQEFPIYIPRIDSAQFSFVDDDDGEKTINYRIVEAYEEDPDLGDREIARLSVQGNIAPASSINIISITFDGIQEGKNRWYKVEKLAQSFADHLKEIGAQITDVQPVGFIQIDETPDFNTDLPKRKFNGVPPATGIPGKQKESKSSEVCPKPIGPPIYIPKRDDVLADYKKAYALFLESDEEFYKEWDKDSEKNIPKPKLEDYRDKLAKKMKWKPSPKTIQRIIDAGDVNFVRGSYKKKE